MSTIVPRFEFGPYKGQDVVHQGIRIPLRGNGLPEVLASFSKNAQRVIQNWDQSIEFRYMTDEDLPFLRAMWFDWNDETFPSSMDGRLGITSVHKGEIVGGVIWSRSGSNLFMHQLVSGKRGKELKIPTLLIWESVKRWYRGEFHSLDIGVSYNPKRYEFFKHFAVETYPIILKPPLETPLIRMNPADGFMRDRGGFVLDMENKTFFPRASYAIYGVLRHLKVGEGDVVKVVKTFENKYISMCVMDAIEATGADMLPMGIETYDRVKAVIVIHEFGIPVYQKKDLDFIQQAVANGIPIIEDCAWREDKVFSSDFAVFSLPKVYGLPFGGILEGVELTDEYLWSIGCLDFVKREQIIAMGEQPSGIERRIENWKMLAEYMRADGMVIDELCDFEGRIETGEWVPTVMMMTCKDDVEVDTLIDRLAEFGIEAGHYWGSPILILPIHQAMSGAHIEYMFAVIKGWYNPCNAYGKISSETLPGAE